MNEEMIKMRGKGLRLCPRRMNIRYSAMMVSAMKGREERQWYLS